MYPPNSVQTGGECSSTGYPHSLLSPGTVGCLCPTSLRLQARGVREFSAKVSSICKGHTDWKT